MEGEDFLFYETNMFIQMLKGHYEFYMNEGFSVLKLVFRDFIVSALLIGLVLFTPVNLCLGIHKSTLLNCLEWFLGAYFIAVALIRYVTRVRSVIISKRELSSWRETAQGTLNLPEFYTYFVKPLQHINKGIYIYFPVIMIIYFFASYLLFSQKLFII